MSQKEGQSEDIDGTKYTVYMLSPKIARTMLVEMGKVIGPALAAISGGQSISGILEKNVDVLPMLSSLMEKLDPKVLDDHMSKLASVSEVDGMPMGPVFDIHFRGELGKMFKWYVFALKANFGNFTSALVSVSKNLPSPVKVVE